VSSAASFKIGKYSGFYKRNDFVDSVKTIGDRLTIL
jgi:hypothetical protein